MRASTTSALAAAATMTLLAQHVAAENWQFAPRLQLGYLYNDNYRLDFPGNELDVQGGVLDVVLPLQLIDPITRAEIAPRVRATLFPNARDEDSTDYFLAGLYERRTQRMRLGLNADLSREDVVRSELPTSEVDADLGDRSTADAGRVLLRNRRDLIRIEPYWQYDASQRNRLEAGAHLVDVTFADNFAGAQEDFSDYGIFVGWGYSLSPRTFVTLRGRASRYETTFDSNAYGAEVEWRSATSETTQMYVRVGGQQTSLSLRGGTSETDLIAGVGGRWSLPTTDLFVDLTSNVGPTSAGAVIQRNQLRLRMERSLRPRFALLAGVRASHDEAVDRNSTYPTREYITGEIGFDWRVTRRWSVLGAYNYIWQEYSDEPADRSSNAVTLGIVYEPGREE